jgi:hypothetical protein
MMQPFNCVSVMFRYLFFMTAIFMVSCERDDELVAIVSFETLAPERTDFGAVSGGRIMANKAISFSDFGVCYNTSENPDINDFVAPGSDPVESQVQESYTINFTANLSGLTPGTTYYLRAFLTTRTGTAYGRQITYTYTAN